VSGRALSTLRKNQKCEMEGSEGGLLAFVVSRSSPGHASYEELSMGPRTGANCPWVATVA
jgi:hypothetical protein